MTSLKELDLSRCLKVTDAGIRHIISISTLEKLYVSETGLTANGVTLISSLKNLSVLDLGGLPVTDPALSSLQVLHFLLFELFGFCFFKIIIWYVIVLLVSFCPSEP
jgi:hypothetical protein